MPASHSSISSNSPDPADSGEISGSDGLAEQLRRRFKPPRLLSVTRAGKFFILMTLAVGFGAINTGNNLLFLLLGMMLSLIVASGLLSEAVLRNLSIRRRLPRRIRAEQPAPGTLRIINDGWWPALSVEASEQNLHAIAGPAAGQNVGPESVPWWKFWRRQTSESRHPIAAAYCMRIDADDQSPLSTHYDLTHRGRYRLPGLQLKTRFPFGLFEKTRRIDQPAIQTVLPRPVDADRWVGQLESQWGDTAQNQRGRGEEFFGLRQYRPGEDQRLIHWKSTARRGEPVVRETEARQQQALLLILDNRAPITEPGDEHRAVFERGVRHLAGLIAILDRRGYRLDLVSGQAHVGADKSTDPEALLRHLAVVELQPSSAPGPNPPSDFNGTRIHIGFRSVVSTNDDDNTPLYIDELAPSMAGETT